MSCNHEGSFTKRKGTETAVRGILNHISWILILLCNVTASIMEFNLPIFKKYVYISLSKCGGIPTLTQDKINWNLNVQVVLHRLHTYTGAVVQMNVQWQIFKFLNRSIKSRVVSLFPWHVHVWIIIIIILMKILPHSLKTYRLRLLEEQRCTWLSVGGASTPPPNPPPPRTTKPPPYYQRRRRRQ